jgi:peptidoglycan/LPS O-acetylase OafA/YrhL/glycosyltransferase involved in cell wall biosynthesis
MDFTLLRLLLALSVVFAHFHQLTGVDVAWAPGLSSTVAVQGFFVVSGWIVTASFELSSGHGAFFVRRLARLYPLYAIVVVAQAIAVLLLTGSPQPAAGEVLKYLAANLSFADFLKPALLGIPGPAAADPAINPSLWTLKIEVMFYLLVPWMVWLGRRHGVRGLLALFAASTLFVYVVGPMSPELARQLPGQLRFFAAGMACRLLFSGDRAPARWNPWPLAAVGAAGLALAQRFDVSAAMTAFQPLFVTAVVVAGGALLPRIQGLPDVSFGVYLLHAPLIQLGLAAGWRPAGPAGLAALLVATLLLATLACFLVERPAIRVGGRWSRRLAGPGPRDAAAAPADARAQRSPGALRRGARAARHRLVHPLFRWVVARLPDRLAVQALYLRRFGRLVDFERPRTLTEKINWRKICQRDPRFRLWSDKLRSKALVAERVGAAHVIPVLWRGDSVDDIPFDALEPPYVVKTNHSCNTNLFVRRRAEVDPHRIRALFRELLAQSYASRLREWGYLGIASQVFVERMLLGEDGKPPEDYKCFVFHGRVRFIQYDHDRFGHHTRAYFDRDWRRLPAKVLYPQVETEVPPPRHLEELLAVAEKIGSEFDFVRVDLYQSGDTVYFGEATFYPGGGFDPFEPAAWDAEFGRHWQLAPGRLVPGEADAAPAAVAGATPTPPEGFPAPTVAILICTYRGASHLRRQLETIVEQTHRAWVIYASDDGSDDATLAILREFEARLGAQRVRIFDGPRRGFAANFLSLIARDEVRGDHYAFTDQDDEWDASKLARAVVALSAHPADAPVLYGSRSELIDPQGCHLGFSPAFTRPPGFSNALVQNMVTGNTMVMNASAMALMRAAGTDVQVSAHDWWAYLLVTGSGGEMVYDPYPTVRYRQHGANLYGSNVSWRARWTRIAMLLKGDFRQWNTQNIVALRRNWALLTQQSRDSVESFERARNASGPSCLLLLRRAGVYRQTWGGQLGLVVAALTQRL